MFHFRARQWVHCLPFRDAFVHCTSLPPSFLLSLLPLLFTWCWWIESRALLLLDKCSTTELYLQILAFEMGSYHVAQKGTEVVIFLPEPPKCWDCRHTPPHLLYFRLVCV